MVLGTIYIVFFADDFLGLFQGFLITLGVPMAAWCGSSWPTCCCAAATTTRPPCSTRAAGTAASGWSAVRCWSSARSSAGGWSPTPSAGWLGWLGYLLEPLGLGGKTGAWAFANLGVPVAFLIGLLGTLALRRTAVRVQERDLVA